MTVRTFQLDGYGDNALILHTAQYNSQIQFAYGSAERSTAICCGGGERARSRKITNIVRRRSGVLPTCPSPLWPSRIAVCALPPYQNYRIIVVRAFSILLCVACALNMFIDSLRNSGVFTERGDRLGLDPHIDIHYNRVKFYNFTWLM